MLLWATVNPGRQRPYFFTASNGAKCVSDCGIFATATTTELEKGGPGCFAGEARGAQGFFDFSALGLAADAQPGNTSKPAAMTASTAIGAFLPKGLEHATASFCRRELAPTMRYPEVTQTAGPASRLWPRASWPPTDHCGRCTGVERPGAAESQTPMTRNVCLQATHDGVCHVFDVDERTKFCVLGRQGLEAGIVEDHYGPKHDARNSSP
jgi:hypothetical protein